MVNIPNTIYEIRYDFDLNGETIEIPEGCTLKFEGGSLKNGVITKHIDNPFINPSYFGAKGNGRNDDTEAIQKAINFASRYKIFKVQLDSKATYLIKKTITMYDDVVLEGNGSKIVANKDFQGNPLINLCYSEAMDRAGLQVQNVNIKDLFIDGCVGAYTSSIAEDSFVQNGQRLCYENSIGISIHSNSIILENVVIEHCHKAISLENNDTYIGYFHNITLRWNYYGIYADAANYNNSGENIRIIASIISNNVIAFYELHFGLYFTNCSIDYNLYYSKGGGYKGSLGYLNHTISFVNCWLEADMKNNDNIQFISDAHIILDSCYIIAKSKAKYFFTNAASSNNDNELICSNCTFILYSVSAYMHIMAVADDSVRATFEGCTFGDYNGFGITQFKNNKILNGDLKTDDVSAFIAGGRGIVNIVETDGVRHLEVTPEMYHGNEYFMIAKLNGKPFYIIVHDSQGRTGFNLNLKYYDREGINIKNYYYTLSNTNEGRKNYPPANADYVVIERTNGNTKISDSAILMFEV